LPRVVQPAEGEALADRIGGNYLECSAKTKVGVDDLFQLAASLSVDVTAHGKAPAKRAEQPEPASVQLDRHEKKETACC